MTRDKVVLTTFLVKFVRIDNIHLETNDRIYVKIGSSKTKSYSVLDRHVFFEEEVFMRQSVITSGKNPKILLPQRDIITVFRESKRMSFLHRKATKIGGCSLNYNDFLFTKKALLGFQLGNEKRHVSLPILRFVIESIWSNSVPQASLQESFVKRHWRGRSLRIDGLKLTNRISSKEVRARDRA